MLDFIKNFDQEKIIVRAKPLVVAALCMAAVFAAGFGAGKMHTGIAVDTSSAKRSLTNYNTNSSPVESKPAGGNEVAGNSTTAANSNTTTPGDCTIKGSKSKIYHLPGGAFYDRTNATQCFATEAEAQAAGYTKSSR